MAESRRLLMFWRCFIITQVKFYISKDCGFNRRKGLSVGFKIRYNCLASCTDHVYFMFINI